MDGGVAASGLREGYPEVRHLTAVAKGLWPVCFDSVSRLSDELADAACRPATGGSFGGGELYSGHDEAVQRYRPIVFNAIPDLGGGRALDFLARAAIVEFLVFFDR